MIVPYFGKIPPAFDLFLQGAARNLSITINWLTDQETQDLDLPANIIVHRTTMQEFKDKAQERLGTSINLDFPYKLCDFRPAFSLIYPELVEGFDYWAFGDFDVVWGDLEGELHARIAEGYDFVTFHNLWVSGAFTLLRNTPIMNNAFQRHTGWKEVFGSREHCAFDECDRRYAIHSAVGDIGKVTSSPPSMTQIFYGMGKSGEIKACFAHKIKEWIAPNEIIEIDHRNKRVRSLENEVEFQLFHWVLKNRWHGFELPENKFPELYFITREGFWEKRSQINILNKSLRRLKGQLTRIIRGVQRRLGAS